MHCCKVNTCYKMEKPQFINCKMLFIVIVCTGTLSIVFFNIKVIQGNQTLVISSAKQFFSKHLIVKNATATTRHTIEMPGATIQESTTAEKTATAGVVGASCRNWISDTHGYELKKIKPRIALDKTRFLYPGVMWGPNNQVQEFWESIYTAVRLNRTLVLPFFYGHHTIGGGKIPADQRIDIHRVCQFVSCVSIQEMREACNSSFDAAFIFGKMRAVYLRMVESSTGMHVFNVTRKNYTQTHGSRKLEVTDFKPGEENVNIPTFPGIGKKVPPPQNDLNRVMTLFESDAKCALQIISFNALLVTRKNIVSSPLTDSVENITKLTDDELYAAAVDAARRPLCLHEAALAYINKSFLGEDFVAVHWRYNAGDWINARCLLNKPTKECEDLMRIKPEDVAMGINKSMENFTWRNVYVATPPNIRDFGEKVHFALRRFHPNLRQTAQADLVEFLKVNFQSCWTQGKWVNPREIVSSVEMEIVELSRWFFFSVSSTWSGNIRPMRVQTLKNGKRENMFEASVFEVAKAAMLDRRNQSFID